MFKYEDVNKDIVYVHHVVHQYNRNVYRPGKTHDTLVISVKPTQFKMSR